MATNGIIVLFMVLSATLAEDIKLKYKSATKPVRLFTEEELQRYDGSQVNFVTHQQGTCLFIHELITASSLWVSGSRAHLHGSKRSGV